MGCIWILKIRSLFNGRNIILKLLGSLNFIEEQFVNQLFISHQFPSWQNVHSKACHVCTHVHVCVYKVFREQADWNLILRSVVFCESP
jgi:hypothetical protein